MNGHALWIQTAGLFCRYECKALRESSLIDTIIEWLRSCRQLGMGETFLLMKGYFCPNRSGFTGNTSMIVVNLNSTKAL